jgi:hypothetical protein
VPIWLGPGRLRSSLITRVGSFRGWPAIDLGLSIAAQANNLPFWGSIIQPFKLDGVRSGLGVTGAQGNDAHRGQGTVATWPEAAEKARYLLGLFALTAIAQDARRQLLIASVLNDFDRLSDAKGE